MSRRTSADSTSFATVPAALHAAPVRGTGRFLSPRSTAASARRLARRSVLAVLVLTTVLALIAIGIAAI